MAKWKLGFVLLLQSAFMCCDSKEIIVKAIGSEPDVTPICTNKTGHIITLLMCRISTKRNSGEECSLLYQHGHDFVHECDSRFKLVEENQTVFLHLTSLKPEDSGNHTCQCSHQDGTHILHLNITVEEDEAASSSAEMPLAPVVIGVFIFIIITGVILGFTLRKILHGHCSRSTTSGLSACQTPGSLDEGDPDDPYTSLQQPASDLYQTISNPARNVVTVCSDEQEVDGGDQEYTTV